MRYNRKAVCVRRDHDVVEEAGIKLNRGKRILLLSAKGFPVEVLFLRDDDIPQSVANGVADIGIVGENKYVKKRQEAKLIKRLGFSKCHLSLAIPKDEDAGDNGLREKRSLLPIRDPTVFLGGRRREGGYSCNQRLRGNRPGHWLGGRYL